MKFLAALLLALAALAGPARADLSIAPLRQVLTPDAAVATYRVSNPSDRIVDGRVAWIDMTATETGYAPADRAFREANSAAPYLTVWPAFFRLEPGAGAEITVAIKDGATPPRGERRSHLLIETSAARTPLRKAGGSLEADIGVGVSTPVLLRNRVSLAETTGSIGETRLLRTPDGLLEVETHVLATGPASAYGRLDILFRAAGAPPAERSLLARQRNLAVYREAGLRKVTALLGIKALPAGVLELRYVGEAEYADRVLASRTFEIAAPE